MNEDNNSDIKEDLNEHSTELSNTKYGNDNDEEADNEPEEEAIEEEEVIGDNGDHKLTKHQKQINWRRHAIFQAMVQGTTNTYELAQIMHISQSTAFRDVRFLQNQATEELRHHLSERLPMQYKVSVDGIRSIVQHAWNLILDDNSKQNKIALLALLAQCYKDLLDMSSNASVVTESLQELDKMKNEILGKLSTTTTTTTAAAADHTTINTNTRLPLTEEDQAKEEQAEGEEE